MPELRDAHRLRCIPKRILHDYLVLRPAENEPNRRLVCRMLQHVIDGRKIEIHLPRILRLERRHFQVNDDKTPELQVIEKKVNPKILSSDFQRILAPDEREPNSQLKEELAYVLEKTRLEVALLRFAGEREEIEVVRVFQELLGEVRLRRRKGLPEVRERLPLSAIKPCLDLHYKDISAPAVLNGLLGVPAAFLRGLNL